MPADFVAPNFQNPDIFGAYLRGQQAGTAQVAAPLQIAGLQQGLQRGDQELQTGALNLQQLKMAMAMQQQAMGTYQQTMAGINGQPAPAGQQPAAADGGIQNGPQGAVAAPPQYDPSNPLAQFLDPRRIAANTALGQYNAFRNGKDPNEVTATAVKLESDARANAINQAKFNAEVPSPTNPMPMFKAFASDPNAGDALANNPQLLALWPQLAKQYGVDPWDKSAVPMVAALEYNRRGAPLGLSVDVPRQLQTTQRGLGESIQTDPLTGKVTAGAPAMATEKYIVNGQVVDLPKAQGVAHGLTPYDPGLYAASIISKPALEDAYKQTVASGTMPPAAGRDPIALAQEKNFIADRFRQEMGPNSGEYLAAKTQAYQAQQKVVSDFTDPGGAAGSKLVAINTAVKHIGALGPLIDALGSGNVGRINQARQAYQTATGVPAPTNFQTLANMATGEINTVVSGAGGGDKEEREKLGAPFASSGGPEVLKGAVNTAVTALAGKTDALRNAWDVGTNGTQGSFDKFLLPDTKAALKGTPDAAAAPKMPTVGTVSKGYKFVGGDPSKQSNWQKQ
jgi:hypothetical protein